MFNNLWLLANFHDKMSNLKVIIVCKPKSQILYFENKFYLIFLRFCVFSKIFNFLN